VVIEWIRIVVGVKCKVKMMIDGGGRNCFGDEGKRVLEGWIKRVERVEENVKG
jgi:hypothetical protein